MEERYSEGWISAAPLEQPPRWARPVSPAIVEHLCKTVATHEERAKSLKALVRDCCSNPNKYMPGVAMTELERNAWASGFCEGMNVVLEYIKSADPAPRG